MKKIFLIQSTTFKLDGGAMFGIIPKPLWEKCIIPDQKNRIPLALRNILIQFQDKNILIDTGIGNYHPEKFNQIFAVTGTQDNFLPEELNISNDDITDIILTHLHFDHAGGLSKVDKNQNIITNFKNATLHIHENHYQHALNPTLKDSGSFHKNYFLPVIKEAQNNKKVNFLSGEKKGTIKISDTINFDFLVSNGHTPYMIHPIVENYIYMADLIPTSHHLPIPWIMGYDLSPGITAKEKIEFINFVKEKNLKMIFEHDQIFFGTDHFNEGMQKFNLSKETSPSVSFIELI